MSKTFNANLSCAIIFACLLFSALTAVADTTPDSALTANAVYQKNCAKCHGKTAEGRHFGGPALISAKTASASAEDLSNIINNGKGRMPKYANKLTPDEINTLVEQIRALNKK